MARSKQSAGIILFRTGADGALELLLVHPGGPFWRRKDEGSWSVPKGEVEDHEQELDLLDVARREFSEETGFTPEGEFVDLGSLKQPSGKLVHVWAVRGEWDPANLISNTFEMEWPRGSGRVQSFPEVDRAAWFDPQTAKRKILKGQVEFVDRLMRKVGGA